MNWKLSTERCMLYLTSPQTEMVKTVNGQVRYVDWLTVEAERINEANPYRKVTVHADGRGYCWATSYPWEEAC